MLQWVGKEVIRMLSQDEIHRLLLRLGANVKDVDTELVFDKGYYSLQDIRRYDLVATSARVEDIEKLFDNVDKTYDIHHGNKYIH